MQRKKGSKAEKKSQKEESVKNQSMASASFLIFSLFSQFPLPTLVPRTKETENEMDRKTKPKQQDLALWLQGSLDDEILDGHSNQNGGEGKQGNDEEGELLVCEASSRLLALSRFRSCAAG